MILTSAQNPALQKLRKAVESGRPLDDGTLAAEGPHLLQEALASAWHVVHVFCSSDGLVRHRELLTSAMRRDIQVTEVSVRAFNTLSDTRHTQGVLTLIHPRAFTWQDLLSSARPIVIFDGVQDPGNAGAIIRSAEAFDAAGVVFAEGCVRVSNGKLLRAAAGSMFRLPFLEKQSSDEIIRQFQRANRKIFTLSASGDACLTDAPLTQPFALVIGSEGSGISLPLTNASQSLRIPTNCVESLNAAVACSVALYEAVRQRHL